MTFTCDINKCINGTDTLKRWEKLNTKERYQKLAEQHYFNSNYTDTFEYTINKATDGTNQLQKLRTLITQCISSKYEWKKGK